MMKKGLKKIFGIIILIIIILVFARITLLFFGFDDGFCLKTEDCGGYDIINGLGGYNCKFLLCKYERFYPELQIHADVVEPIKVDAVEKTVKAGGKSTLKLNIYNDGTFEETDKVTIKITECSDANGTKLNITIPSTSISSISPPQNIPVATDMLYSAIIKVGPEVRIQTYVCDLVAGKYDETGRFIDFNQSISRQIYITVIK
jgi:hypothetical protein